MIKITKIIGLCCAMSVVLSEQTLAHPGWGLEVSETGDVYFTDLVHVYRIDAQGKTHIHVPDVHSHDLSLSPDGTLYGTHEWYDPNSETFKRTYWKVDQEGSRTAVDPAEALRWLGVIIDGKAVMPHADLHQQYTTFLYESNGPASQPLYRHPMGSADGELDQARWGVFADWTITPQFTYFTTGGQVKSLNNRQQVTTVIGEEQGHAYTDDSFSRLLGIDVDADQHIYLADHEARKFLRFDGQKMTVIAEAGWSWTATGINHHARGIYLLEYNRWPWSGAVRVRRIDDDGTISTLGQN